MWFYYDNAGQRVALEYNGEVYYYVYNAQGDVVSIANKSGYPVVYYFYDAWGALTGVSGSMAETVGAANPFLYRGYYFDGETGFYYLNSRYYDPETGRFINADGYVSTAQGLNSHNMFVYCENNPIIRADINGEFWHIVIGGAVNGIVNGIIAGVSSYIDTGEVDWGSVGISFAVGAIEGALSAAIPTAAVAFSAAGAAIEDFCTQVYQKGIENVDYGGIIVNAAVGAGSAKIGDLAGLKLKNQSKEITTKGNAKLAKSLARETMGKSHSKLRRQGVKLKTKGLEIKLLSKTITLATQKSISLAGAYGYKYLKNEVFR